MTNNNANTLFHKLGGKNTLQKVHKIFYDKIYADPWIGKFFLHIDQKIIEDQQTDFMMQAMGGPAEYAGALPHAAHKHMLITEDLFQYRQELLRASIKEAMIPENLAEEWLKIDAAFKKGIVKKSINDCEKRFNTDEILSYQKPPISKV